MYRTLAVFIIILLSVSAYASDRALAKSSDANAKKAALIIGNSNYKSSPLKNPVNDAKLINRTLINLGFETIIITDASQKEMKKAVDTFGKMISGAEVALFYYAGHGMQVKGANYLIPVGAEINNESDVEYESLDADRVLGKMEGAGSAVNIVMLDACRDNPFARSFRSSAKGLATISAPRGSFIAYATAPGSTAADGAGSNGVFTEAFVNALRRPGAEIASIFKEVSREVDRATNGKQTPWTSSSLTEDFYFIQPSVQAAEDEKTAMTKKIVPENFNLSDIQESLNKKAADEAARKAEMEKQLSLRRGAYDEVKKIAESSVSEEIKKEAVKRYLEVFSMDIPETDEDDRLLHAVRTLLLPRSYTDPATGMEFAFIMGGCYQMGSEYTSDEKPVHRVCVGDFYIGKYEVTNAQYRHYQPGHDSTEYKGENLNGETQPAVNVSWDDTKGFISWLNIHTEGGYRLPTEAEWEYAARGGTATEMYWGDDPEPACEYANAFDKSGSRLSAMPGWPTFNCDDGYAASAPVGSFKPNPFGLYDMLGNASEWVEDIYSDTAYSQHGMNAPLYDGAGDKRGHRGGSWGHGPDNIRSSFRNFAAQDKRDKIIGFRLVKEVRQ